MSDAGAIHGFRSVPYPNDHKLARFLRKHNAIDNPHTVANSVTWYGLDGRAVVQCQYDNAASTYKCFIREDLIDSY